MAHLAFIFCCFVWGTSFILLERVTHVFGPVEIGIWRMFSGALVVGVLWWINRRKFRLTRRDAAYLVFAALLFTAPAQVVQAYVLAQGFGHSFFGTMVGAVPLLTILVSIPVLKIRPTARELLGVLGGLACMWLLVEDGVHRGMSGVLLALTFIVPLSSALSNTFIKWKLSHVPAEPLTAVLLFVAGLALVPLQLSQPALDALHVAGPANTIVTSVSVLWLFLLGVVGSGISTMVFVWMILKKGPLFAGMTTYVVPVLALLWGTLDHEMINPGQMGAIAGVLAMVALVQTGKRRPAVLKQAIDEAISPLPLPMIEPNMLADTSIRYSSPAARTTQPKSQVA